MRTATYDDRLVIVTDRGGVDVEQLSAGRFSADPQEIYPRWDEFRAWARDADVDQAPTVELDDRRLGAPTPRPAQILAVGLNYRSHATEAGFSVPDGLPPVFTKFRSAISGPVTEVVHPGGDVDWEVELAVVIGRESRAIAAGDAWSVVAGLTVAQDLSERRLQMSGPAPQFSLGKSYPGFLPLGPHLVTPDEFTDPDDLTLRALVDGEVVQQGTTRDLIVPVPDLIAGLSAVVTLLPGDVILTGTPAGVGMGMKPPRYLQPGHTLTSTITGIGTLRQNFRSPA